MLCASFLSYKTGIVIGIYSIPMNMTCAETRIYRRNANDPGPMSKSRDSINVSYYPRHPNNISNTIKKNKRTINFC